MKKSAIIKLSCATAILATSVFSQAVFATEPVTFQDFTKMTYEQRVQVCAEYVSSEDIGLCAALKSKSLPLTMSSSGALNKAIVACAREENTTSPEDLTSCVNKKLSKSDLQEKGPSDAEMHAAVKACVKDKSLTGTNEIMHCAYGKVKVSE